MLSYLKTGMATLLGKHKDLVKNFPLIKKLNYIANNELENRKQLKQQLLLNSHSKILSILFGEKMSDINLWLDFGTLLGWYRNKGIISHDCDMDFAILKEDLDNFLKKEQYLIKEGFIRSRTFYVDSEIVELSYSYNGLNIDIIVYEGDDTISSITIDYKLNFFNKPARVEAYKYNLKFDGLENGEMNNQFVRVPQNTKNYLCNLYGKDFMIPNENYNWRLNSIYTKIEPRNIRIKIH